MASTTNAVILTVKGEVRNCKLPVGPAAKSILTAAHLMAVLKRKTDAEELGSYKYEGFKLTCFGYTTGRAGTESKHSLPPPYAEETYYGDILVVACKKGGSWGRPVPFTTKDYEEFYQYRLMNEDEDGEADDDDDSYSESSEKEAVAEAEVEAEVEVEAEADGVEDEDIASESEDDDETEVEEEDEAEADLEDGEEGEGELLGEDDDEIVVSKTKGKKKAPPKPTNAAANTGRGKQTYLQQKGTIVDQESIHSGSQHDALLQILRTRCREPFIQTHAEEIAVVIEDSACAEAEKRGIIRHHANPLFEALYKSIVRRIVGNLDPASYVGNAHLHAQLTSGDLTLDTLRSMTIQDMNPGLYKELYDRQLLREQAQLEGNKAMTTEMFKCSRCKKNQCTYYQLQTRSADEPMTTFISCLNCGKRWKE
jgi:transcription elongation factor S-II